MGFRNLGRLCIAINVTFCIFVCTPSLPAQQSTGSSFLPPAEGLFPGRKAQCGPFCLYSVLKMTDKEVDYQKLLGECRLQSDGTSLEALELAAQEHGLHTVGVELSSRDLSVALSTLPGPVFAICQVTPSHFVLCYQNSKGHLTVLDNKASVPRNRVGPAGVPAYGGVALLLSPKALTRNDVDGVVKSAISGGSPRLTISLIVLAAAVAFVLPS